VSFHVGFWQFDANGKTLYHEYDARELESDLIGIAPCQGVNKISGMRSEDDTTYGRHRSFSNVQFLLNKEGAQHENAGEAAENDVYQMRLVYRQMIPSHLEEIPRISNEMDKVLPELR
jgi:hypothetical protein